ncbi:MAG: hypothetical protein ACREBE_16445 [bacterium]
MRLLRVSCAADGFLSQTHLPLSAQETLYAVLASTDEPTLAEYLRVSIATLRRYASGELKMNWVICTRLAALPNPEMLRKVETVTIYERHRASVEIRRERRATRREGMPSQAQAVAVAS